MALREPQIVASHGKEEWSGTGDRESLTPHACLSGPTLTHASIEAWISVGPCMKAQSTRDSTAPMPLHDSMPAHTGNHTDLYFHMGHGSVQDAAWGSKGPGESPGKGTTSPPCPASGRGADMGKGQRVCHPIK